MCKNGTKPPKKFTDHNKKKGTWHEEFPAARYGVKASTIKSGSNKKGR